MANVKGVILNGTKYELQDSEARELAGNAINAVETLENTVNTLGSEVTNVTSDLATVAETATNANTAATEAKTLAEQAETRAQEAYELAEKGTPTVGIITGSLAFTSEQSKSLSETDIKNLFGDVLANITSGTIFLLHFYIRATSGIKPVETILARVISNRLSAISSHTNIINISSSSGVITLTNTSSESVSLLIEAIKQR